MRRLSHLTESVCSAIAGQRVDSDTCGVYTCVISQLQFHQLHLAAIFSDFTSLQKCREKFADPVIKWRETYVKFADSIIQMPILKVCGLNYTNAEKPTQYLQIQSYKCLYLKFVDSIIQMRRNLLKVCRLSHTNILWYIR